MHRVERRLTGTGRDPGSQPSHGFDTDTTLLGFVLAIHDKISRNISNLPETESHLFAQPCAPENTDNNLAAGLSCLCDVR